MDKARAPYPYQGVNGEFYDKAFLDNVWQDLLRKSIGWTLGLDTPTPADRLAYEVLKQITMRMPDLNEKYSGHMVERLETDSAAIKTTPAS